MRSKYASDDQEIDARASQVEGRNGTGESIRISGKEVEEVGFQKIRIQQAKLKELRIIILDTLCISRPSARGHAVTDLRGNEIEEIYPKVTELDLSRNLFEDWSEIDDICMQFPRLQSLRVDGNRFRISLIPPAAAQVVPLSCPFANIKTLGLDDTLLSWNEVRIKISESRRQC